MGDHVARTTVVKDSQRTLGEAWRCEYVAPDGTECAHSGTTRQLSGMAHFRHDCFGHGEDARYFRRPYFVCARHAKDFMDAHAPDVRRVGTPRSFGAGLPVRTPQEAAG